ncbi:hypothetical protein AX14_011145 [Amanita brunnescens Koide BX004]|nr:hypothetical protein AX14_011145 [Amanita brunnescens Koide BX004]
MPSQLNGNVENVSQAQSLLPSIPLEDNCMISLVSTAWSMLELPLSHKVRVNGDSHTKQSTPTLAVPAMPIPPAQDSPLLKTTSDL